MEHKRNHTGECVQNINKMNICVQFVGNKCRHLVDIVMAIARFIDDICVCRNDVIAERSAKYQSENNGFCGINTFGIDVRYAGIFDVLLLLLIMMMVMLLVPSVTMFNSIPMH